jgi:hypothetical protein
MISDDIAISIENTTGNAIDTDPRTVKIAQ